MKANIYDVIKKLCDDKKITISQLEQELGFGVSTISKWKRQNPSTNKLSDVAEYFGVSLDYLTGRTSNSKTSDDILEDYGIISIQRALDKVPHKKKEKALKIVEMMIEQVFLEEDD